LPSTKKNFKTPPSKNFWVPPALGYLGETSPEFEFNIRQRAVRDITGG